MQTYSSIPASDAISGQVWLRGELMQLAFANPATLVTDPEQAIRDLCEQLGLPDKADATQTYAFLIALRQAKSEGLVMTDDLKQRVNALAQVLLAGWSPKDQTPNKSPIRKDKRS